MKNKATIKNDQQKRQRLIFMTAQASYRKFEGSMGDSLVNHIAESELAADTIPGMSTMELEQHFTETVGHFYNR